MDCLAIRVIKGKKEYIQKQYHYVAKEFDISLEELDGKSVMGIISNATYGVNYEGKVSLRIDIKRDEIVGVVNHLFDGVADCFIQDYGVTDVSGLIGKPIKVVHTFNRTFWLEPMKIKLGERGRE